MGTGEAPGAAPLRDPRVGGKAGTAGPGAREQWRSRRGRGGSAPPAPRGPRVPAAACPGRARAARLALPIRHCPRSPAIPASASTHAPPRPDGGSRCLSACTRDIRLPILSRRLLSHFLPPSSHTVRHLLELAVLLGQPTFSLTPPYPFWRSLWTSMALLPHLFSASITFGGKSPSSSFGLPAVIIPALEHLASPGAVPLGPAVAPPWRSVLDVC